MANDRDNPYESPTKGGSLPLVKLRHGRQIAILSLFAALLPPAFMLDMLGQHLFELLEAPSNSYRPITVVFGLGYTALNATITFVAMPLAKRFGDKTDADLALWGAFMIPIPLLLGWIGPYFICTLTGSSFGT